MTLELASLETEPLYREFEPYDGAFASHPQCEVICSDALTALSDIGEDTFRCCVTSPPYWGLRDYGIDHQIGAEPKLQDYVSNLVAVFREVRRVLTSDGTLWLNVGDSYTSGGRTWRDADKKTKDAPWITAHLHQKVSSQKI